jgi:glycosyltransferase involved in cell wall biosynthesis
LSGEILRSNAERVRLARLHFVRWPTSPWFPKSARSPHSRSVHIVARLAVLSSHPIQYYGPLFRRLAKRVDLEVFFAHRATPVEQGRAGFGTEFDWDIDLTSGYAHTFLTNRAKVPRTDQFWGCDTPDIGEQLRKGRFDALLVHGWHLKTYLQGVIAAKRIGLPVMVRGDSHLDTPRSKLKHAAKELAFPHFLRLFDVALYVGDKSRAYYRHYRYPDKQLFFSPHCVDTVHFKSLATPTARAELRSQLRIAASAPVLLFAGKLVPFKRPLDLIAAAATRRVHDKCAEVLVVGDGELRASISEAARRTDVPVHLVGFYNQSRMPAAYAAADVLVLPSSGRETWGLVANEALACGRPIIVSDACGCASDLTADGTAGRVFPVGNVAALSDAISDVLSDPPSRRGIETTARRYSLDAAVDGIVAALASVSRASTK